jgi:hypothetical protein
LKKLAIGLIALSGIIGSVGGTAALAAGKSEGHTPVVVCHWVPAHGGSYVRIVVDDDGADGNKNLRAHASHENDIIAPDGGECPSGEED